MNISHTASREEWLAARLDLLSTYRFLDLTPPGRQRYISEWPWHDTYGTPDRHEQHH
jgi:predicted dithiol-disulfide oxidoreductase (DUF899 family)